jgi:hydrogenase maturation protein HypF
LVGLSRGTDCGATAYTFHIVDGIVDPAPALHAVIADHRAGEPAGVIGARFHHAVAQLIVELADTYRDGPQTVALSGGVFQNALLLRLALNGLRARGFHVITHRRVPPNDGGIALGQLLVGNSG